MGRQSNPSYKLPAPSYNALKGTHLMHVFSLQTAYP